MIVELILEQSGSRVASTLRELILAHMGQIQYVLHINRDQNTHPCPELDPRPNWLSTARRR